MKYRIHQIKLSVGEDQHCLPDKILKRIGTKGFVIADWEIVRESIDARDKKDIKLVYSVDFTLAEKRNPKKSVKPVFPARLSIEEAPDRTYQDVPMGEKPMAHPPVIAGFGPCGIFAGLLLARRGYRPVILERGADVDRRVADVEHFWKTGELNPNSNVQFGEGGAGTFSDGKLTTGIKDPRISQVLSDFVRAGADADIRYKQKPHIGTDVLRNVVKNLREEIIRLGGEIHFNTRLTELHVEDGKVCAVTAEQGGTEEVIPAEAVILAVGHSARDTFRTLYASGVEMRQKPFSIGVRIEHPQELIDRAQYGETEGLPPADYKLSYRCQSDRGVYTFCMCPGGEVVIASSQEGGVVTNGMSNRARNSGTANSALLVDVRCEDFPSDHVLAGIAFQEKYEQLAFVNGGGDYRAPKTTWGEFRGNEKGAQAVRSALPEFAVASICEAMPHLGRKLSGFDRDDAVMTATETRSSSPVRFARDENMEGTFGGLYPAGEGAGYAGGIMSAACDGMKAAEKIIEKYSVPSFGTEAEKEKNDV